MRFTLDYNEYAKLARQAAAEGCVLLKNDNRVLPIQKGERVSVFGRTQLNYYKSGTGSGGMVNTPYVVGILEGLQESGHVVINEELAQVYRDWEKENPFDLGKGWAQEPWCQKEMPVSRKLAEDAAKQSDLALVIIGRTAGEDQDNSATEGSYFLKKEEEEMLDAVCSAFSRTVVVLNVGNIIDMNWVDRFDPQAVLYAWQGGMVGGSGVADVLVGKVNPSGRLSDTIAKNIEDYPSAGNFGDKERNFYAEDIYVGYRYFETFAPEKVKYPFGFGLSYTEFEQKVTDFSVKKDEVSLKVSVKNTGDCDGSQVIQVYAKAPQGKLGKPVRSLVCFGKTTCIPAGETEEIGFSFDLAQAASYDDGGVTGHKSCYVLEPGEYAVFVGTDVRNAVKAGSVVVEELKVTQKLREALAPVRAFDRLRPVGDGPIFEKGKESVPLRSIDLAARIADEMPETVPYTGDKGYKLSDVADGTVSMEDFLAQLSDDDLICMTRGEGMCSPKVTPGTAGAFGGVTDALKGFGIPVACCADGPSGIRMDCGTRAFSMPNGTLLACTFHTALVEKLYEMEGMELRKNQIDTLLGPGMNIHRSPLNGRNFEYFSEDPILTGKMAAAQLRGMNRYGVTGTIKHFAGNNQEFSRHLADGVVSERALREIYLKGFEIAVKEGGAYSIMSTYGPINGIWTAGSYDLLTTILRKEWGYEGIVMTDWWATMNEDGEPAGDRSNTIPMVRAQNDLYMVVPDAAANPMKDNTKEGLKKGKLSRAQLVRGAKNICGFLMRSPVMNRFLDREYDICETLHDLEDAGSGAEVLQKLSVADGTCLDVEKLVTTKGTSAAYSLTFAERGAYELQFKMRATVGGLAQMPMSVFVNNHILETITITGMDQDWLVKSVSLQVFVALESYVKLYFGESGIEIGEIRVKKLSDAQGF